MADDITQSEKKGRIYESYVDHALELCGITASHEPNIQGIAASQDFHFTQKEHEWFCGVTYWGSHEAAKMKFWRITFDILCTGSFREKSNFLHVLFEKNPDSDDGLVRLVDESCQGASVHTGNCYGIEILQTFVATDALISSHPSTWSHLSKLSRENYCKDSKYRNAIEALKTSILFALDNVGNDVHICNWRSEALLKGNEDKPLTEAPREIFLKDALLGLTCVDKTIASKLHDLGSEEVLSNLELLKQLGLLYESGGLRKKIDYTEAGLSIISMPPHEVDRIQSDIMELSDLADSPFAPYREHIIELTSDRLVDERITELYAAKDKRLYYNLFDSISEGERHWPLEYPIILKRTRTKGGAYGMSKFSRSCNIKYIGGVSAVPKFMSGQGQLSSYEISRVKESAWAVHSENNNSGLSVSDAGAAVRQGKAIVLKKKMPIAEGYIAAVLKRQVPDAEITLNEPVAHPLSGGGSAGTTLFNVAAKKDKRAIYIFIISTREATHKHKEVAGRLAAVRKLIKIGDSSLAILIADGNFFSSPMELETRSKILRSSGFSHCFYLDQIDNFSTLVRGFL